ncbi:hypothetical protein C8J27_1014 [Rhodobacter aestuarii]|uniref:Beta/Gamma crystallin n=1 Tax=Rhodobacter aestuarii TaxID=453582 RepID=A0A1N7JDJ3_9RHOB|nr:hypothetical protein [Rhodobacter aestuarii]PTV96896.1 hypothetical protein C8J27_1014 [Rhodobacter aestuarii]SIS47452.1 hypothetical protein SAMN05421580_101638 [Rhodobacter aestuarii]
MRMKIAGLLICLALPAAAENVPMARIYSTGNMMYEGDSWECIQISSTMGWQRYVPPHEPGLYGHDFYNMTISADQEGWTVDKARYARVLNGGHTGADARALSPYDGYKYDQSYPFGALLLRYKDGTTRALMREDPGGTSWDFGNDPLFDFRINDTGFGDNAGVLKICFW